MCDIKIEKFEEVLNCEVEMPGSKSYTNRVLIVATLAKGKSKIIAPLHSDDTKYMIQSLKNLGVDIEVQKNGDILIDGNSGNFKNIKSREIFAGIAGTTSRFLTALSILVGGDIRLNGEGKILERPIRELVDGLRQIGVNIEYIGKKGSLPLKINGDEIIGNKIKINGGVSSQFFTALMLIAPYLKDGLIIEVIGEQVSKSYIDITIKLMNEFGVKVINDDYKRYVIKKGESYKAREYRVEGDWSSSSYFCVLGAIHNGELTVRNLNNNSAQGDKNFPKVLEKMGVEIKYLNDGVRIIGGSKLKGIEINMEQMPDTAMSIAVIAALASGETLITGLSTLRDKETDRIEAMKIELEKIGIRVDARKDSMKIFGGKLNKAEIETYHDHRIAMVFAILATKVGDIIIRDKQVVNKSFPEFWQMLGKIGIKTKEQKYFKKIVLIGFRGSGKSTISKVLAKKLEFNCVDMDKLIVKKAKKTIDEIIKKGSWQEFRKIEQNVLEEVLALEEDIVISAGGGVGVNDVLINDSHKTYGELNAKTFEYSNDNLIVFVDAIESKLLERIRSSEESRLNSRPLLSSRNDNMKDEGESNVEKLIFESGKIYRKRKKFYEKLADFKIDTTKDSVEESVNKILKKIDEKTNKYLHGDR